MSSAWTSRASPAPETARLATLVARADLEADGARSIHERTGGNPLFVSETVRAYLEDGTLEWRTDASRWSSRPPPGCRSPSRRPRRAHRCPRSRCAPRPRGRLGHRHPLRHDDRRPRAARRPIRSRERRWTSSRRRRSSPPPRTATGGSPIRSSTTPRMPACWPAAAAISTRGWRTSSRRRPGRRAAHDGWRSIGPLPATRIERSRCCVRPPCRRWRSVPRGGGVIPAPRRGARRADRPGRGATAAEAMARCGDPGGAAARGRHGAREDHRAGLACRRDGRRRDYRDAAATSSAATSTGETVTVSPSTAAGPMGRRRGTGRRAPRVAAGA